MGTLYTLQNTSPKQLNFKCSFGSLYLLTVENMQPSLFILTYTTVYLNCRFLWWNGVCHCNHWGVSMQSFRGHWFNDSSISIQSHE